MSNRTKVFTGTTKNPASKFLDWKSNDKQFSYYDKEQSKTIEVKLPLKFVFLDDFFWDIVDLDFDKLWTR